MTKKQTVAVDKSKYFVIRKVDDFQKKIIDYFKATLKRSITNTCDNSGISDNDFYDYFTKLSDDLPYVYNHIVEDFCNNHNFVNEDCIFEELDSQKLNLSLEKM